MSTPVLSAQNGRETTPEPLAEADIAQYRQRLAALGLTTGNDTGENPRERELVSMVRLFHSYVRSCLTEYLDYEANGCPTTRF